jgi:glycerol kinase
VFCGWTAYTGYEMVSISDSLDSGEVVGRTVGEVVGETVGEVVGEMVGETVDSFLIDGFNRTNNTITPTQNASPTKHITTTTISRVLGIFFI